MKVLKQGVHLHVRPTSKFKTVSIQFKFRTPLQADQITKRTLLANMMDVNSKDYPTQIDFRKKLGELYGASFYCDVSRYGNYHVLSVNMDCIDGKIVHEMGLFEDVIEFLHQVIFKPNVLDAKFHDATFNREVEKLRDDYLSRYDDKSVYADDKLNELYFDAPEHRMLSYGQLSDLDDVTSAEVYETYLKMIKEDQLDIFIVGNVTEQRAAEAMGKFEFLPRNTLICDPFYKRSEDSKLRVGREGQNINQTILTMGFQAPVYYHEPLYYAGLVFNGIFGGMAHSKLFQKIREEENIAYAVSSDIDAYRGLLSVEAGIEYKDLERTKNIIINQLVEIRKGNFTDHELFQTKELLKSELLQIADSPHSMIESDYSLRMIGMEVLSVDEWINRIDQVQGEEIARLAGMIDLASIFELIGENCE